jgi:hypothetical protein
VPGGFYQRYIPDIRLQEGMTLLRAAAATYRAARQPQIAARIEADLAAMQQEMLALSARNAVKADVLAGQVLRSRLVRPETPGPHLADHVRSYPLPGELGGLGFADLAQLERAIDPKYPQHGTYWRAIEFGSTAQVGRLVVGYFQPGNAAPNVDERRAHAYFTPEAGTGAPAMRIVRPIEAKHFLRDTATRAMTSQVQSMGTLQADAIASMKAATRRGRGIVATRVR